MVDRRSARIATKRLVSKGVADRTSASGWRKAPRTAKMRMVSTRAKGAGNFLTAPYLELDSARSKDALDGFGTKLTSGVHG